MLRKLFIIVALLCAIVTQSTLSADPVIDVYKSHKVKYKRDLKASRILGFYRPCEDSIHLLRRGEYDSRREFNHTALHELGHWTRHRSRLGPVGGHKGSTPDWYEEVVVDISASVIADAMGLDRQTDRYSRRYIRSQVGKRKLKKRQIAFLVDEVIKTSEYITKEEPARDVVMARFVALGLCSRHTASSLLA